jgi:membrane complex biogenesis BtpA family protein
MELAAARLPDRALIGMVHLPTLPGSPNASATLDDLIHRARDEATQLASAGFDALVVENFGDAPFNATRVGPHTVAAMAVITHALRRAVAVPLGVNVLRNDAAAALAIAATAGADFIRINVHTGVYATDQGIIEGRAHDTVRYRAALRARTAILADVHVKHAEPLSTRDIAQAAEETAYRGRADALIVSGTATGKSAAIDDLKRVRDAVPDKPLYVGSGATPDTVADLLSIADGVIAGTALKQNGVTSAPLDPRRIKAFVNAARG